MRHRKEGSQHRFINGHAMLWPTGTVVHCALQGNGVECASQLFCLREKEAGIFSYRPHHNLLSSILQQSKKRKGYF